MALNHLTTEEEPVCGAWQKFLQGALVVFLAITLLLLLHFLLPAHTGKLQEQVRTLTAEVHELQQEQAMPAVVLNRYRNSICYIFGIYQVGFPGQKPLQRTRISGSGFLVADGLIATNRHVAEPWYGDPDSDALVDRGATATLEKLVAYFPGSPEPVNLRVSVLSSDGDLALVRATHGTQGLQPLPLALTKPEPGENWSQWWVIPWGFSE